MTPLQQLTTLIYASNPELLTLGVGCEIQNPVTLQIYSIGIFVSESYCVLDNKDRLPLTVNNKIVDFYRILGKPPTLVDVLKWMFSIKNKDFDFSLHTYSTEFMIGERNPFGDGFAWNLNSIYLRDQSPELINFLINLNK